MIVRNMSERKRSVIGERDECELGGDREKLREREGVGVGKRVR